MNKLFLVRHGRYNGCSSNGGLTEEGIEEAKSAARTIEGLLFGLVPSVFYSPANRTTQTARIIKRKLGVENFLFYNGLWTSEDSPTNSVRRVADENYYKVFMDIITDRFEHDNSLVVVGHYELLSCFPYRFMEELDFPVGRLEEKMPDPGEVIYFNLPRRIVERHAPCLE